MRKGGRTIRIAVDGQAILGSSREIFQRRLSFSFFNHQVDNDQRLEAYRPGRVA